MYNPSLYFFTVDKATEALRHEWVIRDIYRINSKTRTRTGIWIPKFGAVSFESFFFLKYSSDNIIKSETELSKQHQNKPGI